MRFLSDADVTGLVSVAEAAKAVEEAFRSLSEERATIKTRIRTDSAIGKLSVLGAVLEDDALAGAKVYSTAPDGKFSFAIVLFDPEESRWLASLEAGELTRIRTAATSVMAARHLARPDATVLTIFGAGSQAAIHVDALAASFPLEKIRVVHHRSGRDVVDTLRGDTGVVVNEFEDAGAAVSGADLVVTATRAPTPLFPGSALSPGTHVTSVGATLPTSRELDQGSVERADRIFVESREQSRYEAGNLIGAGVDWAKVDELADLASGRVAGRATEDEVTLFDSLGSGLADIAVAALCYRKALVTGHGIILGGGEH